MNASEWNSRAPATSKPSVYHLSPPHCIGPRPAPLPAIACSGEGIGFNAASPTNNRDALRMKRINDPAADGIQSGLLPRPSEGRGVMSERAALAPLIAVIGCDGSGKSTVSAHVLAFVRSHGPATAAHLGKQSGNIGRALARLPLVGEWFGRAIKRKAEQVRDHRSKSKTPGVFPALVIGVFTLRRVLRFRRMLTQRRRGLIVVADRYPQMEAQGAYDCPGLSVSARGSRLVRWLAHCEHAAFAWMTSYRPDLVIRLNVDLDIACARKPDHRRDNLERKIASTPLLTFNGAHIVDIDANRALAEVMALSMAAVASVLTARGLVPAHVPTPTPTIRDQNMAG